MRQPPNPATTDLELTYTTSGYSGPMGSNPLCDVAGQSPLKVLDWKLGSMSEFIVSSAPSAGYTPDKLSRCGVAQWARSDLNLTWLQLQRTNVRQDSAPYLGTGGASVFQDWMGVFWKYSWASPTHGQVADHIWDAQTDPANTYPAKAGKAVPGRNSSGKPLTRLANQTVWDTEANTRRADTTRIRTAACDAITPRPPDGWQCDEYPFASTWEGAGLGDGNYSLRYVAPGHNLEAGTMLGQWYLDERIIHREAFYTEIAP
ncbi:NucA/NucB deoxyribonuclease domain-containing protein [Streptomyces erythrochromogenes]|uniref:NucA/NucB deoxyribonuclease domain-containing protein n=1 Tax=Streptomyces erythrochromogenes TaxID=285574 RepID=UPI00343744F5